MSTPVKLISARLKKHHCHAGQCFVNHLLTKFQLVIEMLLRTDDNDFVDENDRTFDNDRGRK
jgi:hypothetical protein